ncbi:MAG: glutamate--tRNA ligase [Phycisphaerales bacterium]|jgi:glutamyl-tRNA synthetase|nr:glutamate--tRNA ligase [Phycisphaerales bacterium]
MPTPVITRFAPSPTGHLHIGGARTALFCWAYARRHDGRFLLRIEDTDQARSSDEAARGILEDLAWLGIDWDEGPAVEIAGRTLGGDPRGVGPFFQARRLETYNAYLDWLIDRDLAYPAFDTPEELGAMRAEAEREKRTFRYARSASYDRGAAMARYRAGEACVVRLRLGDADVRVRDDVLGDIAFEREHIDDFVLRKADGFPTYHFAVVIDDELMGVTHILRGQEHLNNTPRHVALQQALRRLDNGEPFRTPVYAHLPLIFNPDNSKMSKRDKAKAARRAMKDAVAAGAQSAESIANAAGIDPAQAAAFLAGETDAPSLAEAIARVLGVSLPEIEVEDFRAGGYLPEVLVNYLALLGWNPKAKNADGTDLEKFDAAYLGERFDLPAIGKTASKFDRDKLRAFNFAAIQAMDDAQFAAVWRAWCARYDREVLARLGAEDGVSDRMLIAARAAKPRCNTLAEARGPVAFALIDNDAIVFDEKAVEKVLKKPTDAAKPELGTGAGFLRVMRTELDALSAFTPEAIDAWAKSFAESRGVGMGKVAQPLRVAITGGTVSPGLGETLALVGKASVLARIDRCVAKFA